MNVLFIMSHDISLRFGCYGDATAVTPAVDRLAAESMVFENHFCQYALCAPSRTNIFTGCRPDTTGRFTIGNETWYDSFRKRNPWARTLPEHLMGHGWRTQSLHKLYHECENDPPSWSEEPWYAPWEDAPEWTPDDFECMDRATRYRNPESRKLMEERFETLIAREPNAATEFKRWRGPAVEAAEVSDRAYPAGKVASRACRELHRHGGGRPFFLGVGFAVTHLPWLSPRRYWDLIPEEKVTPVDGTLIEGIADRYRVFGNEAYQYFETDYLVPGASRGWKPTPRDAVRMTRGYYAAISYLDAQIGRILEALEEEGLREKTIVLFTTDHGFSIGEHGHWGKHCIHEPDLRTPLIIRAPGFPPGRTGRLTEHVDLFPTICDLLNVATPGFVEGRSLAPLLAEPDRPWTKAVFSQVRSNEETGYSVRSDRFRYNRWVDHEGTIVQEELYDYHEDPGETRSVRAERRYSATLEEMRELFDLSGFRLN